MTFDPGLDGWSRVFSPGYFAQIGPLWEKGEGDAFRIGLLIDERHGNINSKVHGGVILSLAKQALSMRLALANGSHFQAMLEIDVQFVAAGKMGDFIEGTAEVVRLTRTLAFMRGQLLAGDRVLAMVQALWAVRGNEDGQLAA